MRFFLTGVAEQAIDAVECAERLVDLREQMRGHLTGDRSRAGEVVGMIFENPVLTVNRISAALGIAPQSALNHVRRLQSASIVIEVAGVPGRSKRWVAPDVLHMLGADDEPFTFQPAG